MEESRTLKIDCSPLTPRPDYHFKMSGAKELWFENKINKNFGEWTWTLKSEHYKDYDLVKDAIGTYLKQSYSDGSIRYAEW
jgi:hypothetical protein